jgi:hypothetical protein
LKNPDRAPLRSAIVVFLALTFTTFVLWLLTASLGNTGLILIGEPLRWLRALDSGSAYDALSNAAEVVAAVLAIAITVVAIVVELAANRYSHLITRLFIREPVNVAVLGLFVVTTIQCVWTAITLTEYTEGALIPQAGFAITMLLVTLSLLLLLPYIYFVFTFLSPISVIERIGRNAINAIRRVKPGNVELSQARVKDAIDELQDVCRGAIVQGDRGIAMAGVSATTGLIRDYAAIRHDLPDDWFRVTQTIERDADFLALAADSLAAISEQGVWLESKVFRHLYALMTQSAMQTRDVANLIGIQTRGLGRDLGEANSALLGLCILAFNSYLRTTINAGDARSAYYLMNQYRMLAEDLLKRGDDDRVLEITGYFREYGQLAHRTGLSFLLEAAAHDVVLLIEQAIRLDSHMVDLLLGVLLELDQEIKEESQEDSLLGVRRAQIQLATLFLQLQQNARAQRIVMDLKSERIERLERLRAALEADERPQYWELTDRGANFAYLAPERREYLAPLFALLRE